MPRDTAAEKDNTLVISRVFNAPREALWRAWTNPQAFAQWSAPKPFTIPFAELDVRPGARYRFAMRDQDGNDFVSTGEYQEIDEPYRLVYTDSLAEMPSEWVDMLNKERGEEPGTPVPDGIVTVTIEETGEGTKLTFTEEYDSKATRDAFVKMQMVDGFEMTLDNLEELVSMDPEEMSC